MTMRMSTHELLELASLDALGLLSDEEREAFDTAFRAAPPALQAQLRAEQARVARDDSLLPAVQAPVGLRARVLAAVRDAMQTVSGRQVAGRIAPDILPGRGVSPLWRAAAIGALAASIVFAIATLQMRHTYDVMHATIEAGAWQEAWMNEFGARFQRLLYDPQVEKVHFAAEAGNETIDAVLLIHPKTGEGELLCRNLPKIDGGEYRLVRIDDAGAMETIASFQPSTASMHQPVAGESVDGMRLALVSVERGGSTRTLLTSRAI